MTHYYLHHYCDCYFAVHWVRFITATLLCYTV